MPTRRSSRSTETLDKIVGQLEGQEQTANEALTGQEKDDDTRQEVAKKFVGYYFGILIFIILFVPFYNVVIFLLTQDTTHILPLKDIILTYSAVAGPTMGLVVAYYFKTSRDK